MSQPLFSIVIPTFNYGRFLGRAIDSALAQPGDDFELAVVDDGSTDDTPRVATAYGDRVRYVRQERGGVFLACKRGLEATGGKFLIFFDADDVLGADALAVLRREIERRPDVGLVAGRHVNVTVAGRRESPRLTLGSSRERNFRSFLLGRQFICTGAAAIRREAVERLATSPNPPRVGMETACVAQTLWHFDAVSVSDVLLEVHDHPGRLRDNLGEIQRAGEALVDAVFRPTDLPAEAMRHRAAFRARLLRDRGRSYHKAGLDAEAAEQYVAALRCDPRRTLCDVRNVRRYVISEVRKRRVPEVRGPITALPSAEPGVVKASGAALFGGHRARLHDSAIELVRTSAKLGDVVKLELARPTYLLSDPRDILHVFVEQPARYLRNGLQAAFRPLFGRGLFTRTGRSHIEHRRMVQPLLHRGRLERFVPPLRRTLAEFVPGWRDGVLDVSSTIMDITMRASARMVLGIERAGEAAELFAAIHGSHQRVVRNMKSRLRLPAWAPTKRNRTLWAQIGRLNEVMSRLIGDARQSRDDGSLLAQLVRVKDAHGAGLSDPQIRDHALTIFLAAYEPPATGLSWILHLLGKHTDAQAALQRECDAAAGQPGEAGDDAAVVWQRPLMAQVIQEAMRLYPSTWILTRRAAERDPLPSGATIPRGADVLASPLAVHRDERHFEAPDEFRPQRFAHGAAELKAAGIYFPFGLGPTACLGEYLAKLMMATAVDAILSSFTLAAGDGNEPRLQSFNMFTMQADRPIRLTIARRSHRAAA